MLILFVILILVIRFVIFENRSFRSTLKIFIYKIIVNLYNLILNTDILNNFIYPS